MRIRNGTTRVFSVKRFRLKSTVQWVANRLGYRIVRLRDREDIQYDMDEEFRGIYETARAFTQTKMSNMYALYAAVRYVVESGVPGDIVECGVWRGGSSMVVALTLLTMGDTTRRLWLYDTYAGMVEPSHKDTKSFDGLPARRLWSNSQQGDVNLWNYSPLDDVKTNLRCTKYPENKIVFVEGRVEDTMPASIPHSIAVLRLDTDFYESTYHELRHLFPLLSERGVLIIDDYGTWTGSKEATDQYFAENNIPILLNRIDEGARIALKLPS